MKKILLSFLITVVMSLLFSVTTAFAASDYQVYLNGKRLEFKTTQPINLNDRVMVPVREIGELLGMSVVFDDPTQVMVFSKPGYTIVHRMYTDSINVNGNQRSFDVPSTNRDGRTLMPVRMLSEAIGAEVTYVSTGSGGIVYINTISAPAVNSIEFSANNIKSNESVTITVFASNRTSKMKLYLSDGTLVSETSTYTTTSDGARKFVFTHIPTINDTNFMAYKAVPGNEESYYDETQYTKTSSIIVNALPAPIISDITIKRSTVTVNDDVTFTVKANQYTEKIKISNDYNDKIVESTTYETSGDGRTFSISVKMEKEGAREFKIEPANVSGYVDKASRKYTIDVMSTTAVTGLRIVSITPSPKSVKPNNTVTVTVVTSKSVTRVSLLDGPSSSVDNKTRYVAQNDYNGTRTWELKVKMSKTGLHHFFVVAYEGTNSVEQRIQLECSNDASTKDLTIWSATPSYNKVKINTNIKITVVTSTDIDWVSLIDSDGNEVDYLQSRDATSVNNTANEKKWVFSGVTIPNTGTNTFTIRAYDIYNDFVSDYIYVTGTTTGNNSNSSGSGYYIISVDPEEANYEYDDYVYVEVETGEDADSVEIFDDNGNSVAYKSSSSSTHGNNLVWRLSYRAKGNGMTYYTVETTDSYSSKTDYTGYFINITN